jgi:hypothetical protein
MNVKTQKANPIGTSPMSDLTFNAARMKQRNERQRRISVIIRVFTWFYSPKLRESLKPRRYAHAGVTIQRSAFSTFGPPGT